MCSCSTSGSSTTSYCCFDPGSASSFSSGILDSGSDSIPVLVLVLNLFLSVSVILLLVLVLDLGPVLVLGGFVVVYVSSISFDAGPDSSRRCGSSCGSSHRAVEL